MSTATVPKLLHPQIGETPECADCGEYLDDDDLEFDSCKDCQAIQARREYFREHGYEYDDPYYGTGRGIPRI